MELGSCVVLPFTDGALTQRTAVPVLSDAVLAEVVSTWCTDWICEHFQTNAAQKLVFRQQTAGSRHVHTGGINGEKGKTVTALSFNNSAHKSQTMCGG